MSNIITSRRKLLTGLFAAPAIIAYDRLMPVKLWVPPAPKKVSVMLTPGVYVWTLRLDDDEAKPVHMTLQEWEKACEELQTDGPWRGGIRLRGVIHETHECESHHALNISA